MQENLTKSLRDQHCVPRKGGNAGMSSVAIAEHLTAVPSWTASDDGTGIDREFRFPDYFHTMAFVNAVASIAHREDHHPDLEVGYNRCAVHYSTHDVGGLSLNDFICAAKVDDLLVIA